jgi:hypothetical protein
MNSSPTPYSLSALGRSIDLEYKSNLIAVVGALAAAVLFGSYNLIATAPLQTSWVGAGIGAFLAWAIARELDPDRPTSATNAIAVSTLVSLVAPPSLLTALGVLIGARLVTGSANVEMGRFDPVVVVGLGALLGAGRTSPAAVPVLLAGIVIFGDRSRRSIVIAVLTAVAAAASMIVTAPLVAWHPPDLWTVGFLVAALLAMVVIIPAAEPVSQTDSGESVLVGWRVSASRVAAAGTVAIAFAVSGEVGTKDVYATVGAALLAVALARVGKRPVDPSSGPTPKSDRDIEDQQRGPG